MGAHRQWRLSERDARVANAFERPRTVSAEGMVVNVQTMSQWGAGPGGPAAAAFNQGHLQEAYELGRRSRRAGGAA